MRAALFLSDGTSLPMAVTKERGGCGGWRWVMDWQHHAIPRLCQGCVKHAFAEGDTEGLPVIFSDRLAADWERLTDAVIKQGPVSYENVVFAGS